MFVLLKAMVIIAWSSPWSISTMFEPDTLRSLKSLFITAAFLNFVQGTDLPFGLSALYVLAVPFVQKIQFVCFTLNPSSYARHSPQFGCLAESGVLRKEKIYLEVWHGYRLGHNYSNILKLYSKSHLACQFHQQFGCTIPQGYNLLCCCFTLHATGYI